MKNDNNQIKKIILEKVQFNNACNMKTHVKHIIIKFLSFLDVLYLLYHVNPRNYTLKCGVYRVI